MDYPPLYKKSSKQGMFHIMIDCCIQLYCLTCIMILMSYYVSVVDGLFGWACVSGIQNGMSIFI